MIARKELLEDLLRKRRGRSPTARTSPGDGAASSKRPPSKAWRASSPSARTRRIATAAATTGARSRSWRATSSRSSASRRRRARAGFGSLLLARPDPEHGWRYAGRVGTGFSDELIAAAQAARPRHACRADRLRAAARHRPAQREVDRADGRGRGVLSRRRQRGPAAPALAEGGPAGQGSRTCSIPTEAASQRPRPPDPRNDVRLSTPNAGVPRPRHHQGRRRRLLHGGHAVAAAGSHQPAAVDHPLHRGHRQGVLLPEAPHGRACRSWSGADQGGVRRKRRLPGRRERIADGAGAVQRHRVPSLGRARPTARARRPHRLRPRPGPRRAVARDVAARPAQVRELAGRTVAEVLPANLRRQGPARGGAAESGLHWATVKPFARALAESLAAGEPSRYRRHGDQVAAQGRIFVDYLRNGRGATSVASYSLRARPGAPVAVPLSWEELPGSSAPMPSTSSPCPRGSRDCVPTPGKGSTR